MLASLDLSRFDIWRRMNWSRNSSEFVPNLCIIARLKIVDRDFWIDGAVLTLTQDGALFREASTYMLRRQNVEVVLDIESTEYPARLISTGPNGYQLEFFELLADDTVSDLSARWHIDA